MAMPFGDIAIDYDRQAPVEFVSPGMRTFRANNLDVATPIAPQVDAGGC